MPLYEYECQACHRRIEKIQSFSADPLRVCEACGGPLEKLISAPAIQFKGSGWYVTDYKKSTNSVTEGKSAADSKPSGDAKSADTPSTAPPSASTPAASESKPAPIPAKNT